MKKFILGKKIGMTTIYGDDGAQNVTLVECGAKVSGIRKKEGDGYSAVQLEINKTKNKSKKKEFRVEESTLEKDAILDVSIFEIGDVVNVSGTGKAKGFQGGVKRHGFKGSPASHGHKHDLRAPGSIGAGFPEHVIKGKRMAGRMGGKRTTSKNIKVVYIDKEKNVLGLKGSVPGIPGGVIEIYIR
ncbi:MAG TPA: 50S ribosomal protein L3 [Candidatus Moranbacteria bacterium]|nr:50S ribosomal protein L3 [Candidatus Moranbacteria bacterium]